MVVVDPIRRVTEAAFLVTTEKVRAIAEKGPFATKTELSKYLGVSSGSIRKFFDVYEDSLRLIVDKRSPSLTELGRIVYRYLEEAEFVQVFDTPKPQELLELYSSSQYPAIFKEVNETGSLRNLNSLKRKGVVEGGKKATRKSLAEAIASGEGTFRLLTPKGQKLVEDVNNVFSLMSYYAASSVEFRRVDEDHEFWYGQLSYLPPQTFANVMPVLVEVIALLHTAKPSEEAREVARKLRGVFEVRTAHLPLARLPLGKCDFVVEGKDVFAEMDKRKAPDIITIGRDAWLKSNLFQTFFPIGLINSNTLQFISKGGLLPRRGDDVRVLNDPKGSEWWRKQSMALAAIGAHPHNVAEASRHADIGEAIVNQQVEMAVVIAPVNYLAGIYGYQTVDIPRIHERQLYTNAVLLIRKEVAKETPSVLGLILDACKKAYNEFSGVPGEPSTKFDHFVRIPETKQLNDYSRSDILRLATKEFNHFVNERTYQFQTAK